MSVKELLDKVLEIAKGLFYVNDDGGIEIYTDYRDREMYSNAIAEFMESENPRQAFEDKLNEQSMEYAWEYGYSSLEEDIKEKLTEEEKILFDENRNAILDTIYEHIYFYYDENDFNNDVEVNIMVDCGNWNYDCACDNVLNYCGNGALEQESSILWLAKTQGKATALRKACKKAYSSKGYYENGTYVPRKEEKDKFVESCIEELENLTSHMGTVTFLVKMSLFELFDLIELQNNEYDKSGEYDPRKNQKSKSYIVLKKDTVCGLYDSWNGGGSTFEINLYKDVKLPIKYCVFCVDECRMHGYDVGETYGFCSDAWRKTLLQTQKVA